MSEPLDPSGEQQDSPQRTDLLVRSPLSGVCGFRRRTIRLAMALLAVVVAALIFGLGIDFRSHATSPQHKIEPPPEGMQPSPIADLPSTYADLPQPKSPTAAMALHHPGERVPTAGASTDGGQGPNADLARLLASIRQVGDKNRQLAEQIAAYQSAAAQEQAKVLSSGLFFKLDDAPSRQPASIARGSAGMPGSTDALATALKNGETQAAGASPLSGTPRQPTDQERKLSFLNDSSSPRAELSPLNAASPGKYELQTGTVIPAALLTGINTDLPGDLIATVTAPVYDSATGNHLLIPQGAKLYGNYDSQVSAAQNRALLVWRRLLLPDGRSVDLDRMRGTDAAGYAGLSDQVDYHTDKLAAAAVLSGVVAYAGNLAAGRQTLTLTPGDVVGDAVAQQAASTGSNVLQRQLNVQPTITIRPGWPVRVLVNRDILLPTYTD